MSETGRRGFFKPLSHFATLQVRVPLPLAAPLLTYGEGGGWLGGVLGWDIIIHFNKRRIKR